MSLIDIHRKHHFSKSDVRKQLDQLRDKLKSKLGIDSEWNGDQLDIHGRGAKGNITISDNDIHVQLKLGLLLSALAPTIREKIERGLDEVINAS